jgi:cell division protease FtsH
LLEGSPGTGKTLLARAVAGEAGVPFISASGSEFIEMFVGVGASRVRKLFENANKNSPCVIFIDEIDAVGRQRGAGIAGGNDEREQTLNQILTNMDGFSSTSGIIVIAATNRADILDNALTRPGRFDRKVTVPLPSLEGRKSIFGVHLRNKQVGLDVDVHELATITTQFSGADIANLANEAAILSVRKNSTNICRDDFFDAFEKVTIGLTSNIQETDDDIIDLVSFHETGHAFMAALFHDMFDLRKVTINGNTGGVGGYTLFTPKEKFSKFATKRFLLANLIIALGGRAAEIYLYRNVHSNMYNNDNVFTGFEDLDVTTGASNDLMQANNIARNYITKYGFGDNIGLYDSSDSDLPFMGREMAMSNKKISEYTRTNIDEQTSALVKFAYLKAVELIKQNDQAFLKVVRLLKENRTIGGKEVVDIVNSHSCQVILPED